MTTIHDQEKSRDAARERLAAMVAKIAEDLYAHGLLGRKERVEVSTAKVRAFAHPGDEGSCYAHGDSVAVATDELTPADLAELHAAILERRASADVAVAMASARLAVDVGGFDAIAADMDPQ